MELNSITERRFALHFNRNSSLGIEVWITFVPIKVLDFCFAHTRTTAVCDNAHLTMCSYVILVTQIVLKPNQLHRNFRGLCESAKSVRVKCFSNTIMMHLCWFRY